MARKWTHMMAAAIRSQDDRPVTIGLLPLTTGPFAPANIAHDLDLLTVHIYPTTGRADDATSLIRSFANHHEPVLLGETFILSCDAATQKTFLTSAAPYLAGTFEFFNGQDPRTMHTKTISDAIYQIGLRQFLTLRHLLLARLAQGSRHAENCPPVSTTSGHDRPAHGLSTLGRGEVLEAYPRATLRRPLKV